MNLKNNNTIEKIIYYDCIKTEEFLFLYFLYLIGLDVLIVDTLSMKLDVRESYLKEIPVNIIQYDYSSPKKPLELKKNKIETISLTASREIGDAIFNQDTAIFKPRQLMSYEISPILLYVIYEEIPEVLSTEIRYREGFGITKNKVSSPQLFLKIDGVNKDLLSDNIQDFSSFNSPKLNGFVLYLLDSDRENIKACIQYRDIEIDNLIVDYDVNLSKKLKDVYLKLTNSPNEYFINDLKDNRKFLKIIESAIKFLVVNKQNMFAIKKIDMPFLNQKVIIFDYGSTNLEDKWIISIQCLFFYLMGFDVLILSPVCNTVVESTLDENYYQKIILQNVYSEEDSKMLLKGLKFGKNQNASTERNKKPLGSAIERLKGIFKG